MLAILIFFGYSTISNTEEIFVKVPSKEEKIEIIKPSVVDATLVNPVEKIIIFENLPSSESL